MQHRTGIELSENAGIRQKALAWLLLFFELASSLQSLLGATVVTIELPSNATPRIQFAAEKLTAAVHNAGMQAFVGPAKAGARSIKLSLNPSLPREGFRVTAKPREAIAVQGGDDSGILYGCYELADRIRDLRALPAEIDLSDQPTMTLRGTCIGMQKTGILPGRKVYEYPYTPELFPWFYDKDLWVEYLDFLAANRFNSLYLWNGHPFSSLVRLPEYPEAVEVSDEVFAKNVEMFRWLTEECDKRGIWLVQMFYNIFLPKPLAEKHGLETQLSGPIPLAEDYSRKAIAEFVRRYPNVGLMVCLGEALQGTTNQIRWATRTILPGVRDGMRAAGLKLEPPVVIRTHAMNAEAIMPACFQVYSNLFTETKYNGESLTTYEPRGKVQATHLAMAKLGPHMVNVHILSNLEPFRYAAQRFIRKSVVASRDRLGATGLHLYPLAYWNWPYSPDQIDPPLTQWDRDWMWFEAWGRYAWNPDRPEDREFWVKRLGTVYGCDASSAGRILDGCNDAGEVAPILIRRFGITEGNRQTLSLGMTLDQLVNPRRYNAYAELWECQAPPGERLDEFVAKELSKEPHLGETPDSAIRDALDFAQKSVSALESVKDSVKVHKDEFSRLLNDARMIRQMAQFYAAKVESAKRMLLFQKTGHSAELEVVAKSMVDSIQSFEQLTKLATGSYRFANSMQTGHRKIPFPGAVAGTGTNYHWAHVLPLYRQEFETFQSQRSQLKAPRADRTRAVAPWPSAKFTLHSTNAEVYEVKAGARPFADRTYTILELAPELQGLTGIRFSHELAKKGGYEPLEFEVSEPVRVLIGYFQSDREIWLQVPNLDVASHADEKGGVDTLLRDAAAIEGCPNVNVHALRYGAGRHKLELIGKGSFVVLGMVPQNAELMERSAGILME